MMRFNMRYLAGGGSVLNVHYLSHTQWLFFLFDSQF